MTSHEPQTHDAAGAEELWLTYLNHDRSVQQAVRRLGALSHDNVELFRTLLLKGRDRSRVKDYEAESIRQLQGEAFVDDEALQTALIVMHAEDPHLGEELKRAVAAAGKPENLDRLVADIRAQNGMPAPAPRAKSETPRRAVPSTFIPIETAPVFENSPAPASPERRSSPFESVIVPAPQVPRPQATEPPRTSKPSAAKRVAIAAAILALGIAAMALLTAKLGDSPQQTASVQTPEPAVPQPAATAPIAAPQPQPAPAMRTSAHEPETPAAPQTTEIQPPATQAPATSAMATRANAPAGTTPMPVPGAHYTVVRGDMLSQIALQAYKDPAKFPLILRANPNLKHGPDIIYYDQVIFIPPAP
ncbi:MAG TPA: hypothetical protein VJS47_00615 [Rhizomicrobium sp.]|nr:hypothetical protein [Rhizomicrobium sp.]